MKKPEEIRAAIVRLFAELKVDPRDALEACMFLVVRIAKDFGLPREQIVSTVKKLYRVLPQSEKLQQPSVKA